MIEGLVGILAAIAAILLVLLVFRNRQLKYLKGVQERLSLATHQQEQLQQQVQNLKTENGKLTDNLSRARQDIAVNTAKMESREQALQENIATLKNFQELQKLQFEKTAETISKQQSLWFEQQSNKSMQQTLHPLQQKLHEFEQAVKRSYDLEAKERFALKSEVSRLIEAGQAMSDETQRLTQALKGDVKVQGTWGEQRLELILERSGLKKGSEYITQGEGLALRTEDGKLQKPDVIVNLPEGKHLVIDAKVSLTDYEKYYNSEDASRRHHHAQKFLLSMRKHIAGLGSKHYQSLAGLATPDFVLMFCPLEPAFTLSLQEAPELLNEAWEKRVALVSPSTLMATLQTIAALWKSEQRNQHAVEIARQGGALYDKFVSFISDLQSIGKSLDDSQKAYQLAFSKLSQGRGNLVRRAERLREMGGKTSKELPAHLFGQIPESKEQPISR